MGHHADFVATHYFIMELWRTFCCHVTMSTVVAFLHTMWFQSSIESLPLWKLLINL